MGGKALEVKRWNVEEGTRQGNMRCFDKDVLKPEPGVMAVGDFIYMKCSRFSRCTDHQELWLSTPRCFSIISFDERVGGLGKEGRKHHRTTTDVYAEFGLFEGLGLGFCYGSAFGIAGRHQRIRQWN